MLQPTIYCNNIVIASSKSKSFVNFYIRLENIFVACQNFRNDNEVEKRKNKDRKKSLKNNIKTTISCGIKNNYEFF